MEDINRKVTGASEKQRVSNFTLIVSFICFAVVGICLLPLLPVKLVPSKSLPSIEIRFNMYGNTARIVEMEATAKLESMLSRVKGIHNLYSTSGNGFGSITIELDRHTQIDVARFEVSNIVRQTWPELSREVSYPEIMVRQSDESASRPFISYTINSALSTIVIQTYAENVLKGAFSNIKGISKIDVGGALPMEWQLAYDNSQLQAFGVSVWDIRHALSESYSSQFLGTTETQAYGKSSRWIRATLSPEIRKNAFDPAEISVLNNRGALIRLDQLVNVKHEEKKPSGYFRVNGLNSVYIAFSANESVNQLSLSEKIRAQMKQVEKNLPLGYEMHIRYDTTRYIQQELEKIYIRGVIALGLLLLFIFLCTWNWRYLLLLTIGLTINLAIAVILYYAFHLEIQLYSLAAIAISLSLIINNFIVVADHYLYKRYGNIAVSISGATVTTLGVLLLVFLFDQEVKLNLRDFTLVMMVNLLVSWLVALLFVPAFLKYLGLSSLKKPRLHTLWPSQLRFKVRLLLLYGRAIDFLITKRKFAFVFIILLFGLPVFMIPEKISGKSTLVKSYNHLMKNELYKEKVRPVLTKGLGGTLRLFSDNVLQTSHMSQGGETVLTITASMPNGTQLEQMNSLIIKMEAYISSFREIRQFQTSVQSPQRASIDVFFKKDDDQGSFPYKFKEAIINKALELGGGSWGVYGLRDQGFNNDVRDKAGQFRIKLYGYNYDELSAWADTLKNRLMQYRRINQMLISSNFSKYKDDYEEYIFAPDRERLAARGVMPSELFSSLQPIFAKNILAASININGQKEDIILYSKDAGKFDIWSLRNVGQYIGPRLYKLHELARVEKEQAPREIAKENQQYRLVLQYDYIGWSDQSNEIMDMELEKIKHNLPLGYTIKKENLEHQWDRGDHNNYYLIALLALIVLFITAILFNSVKQPFAIIFTIAISFIGVFIAFYWFRVNFDQGGFASFILLSAITANASIYIINEYNEIRMRRPLLSARRAYIRAFRLKIAPICLTVFATIVGFLPYLIGSAEEAFWHPLAVGTIGGLLMSFIGTLIFLPLLVLDKKKESV